MFAPSIAFIDLETTGTVPTGDRVTEVGIVRVEDGQLAWEWATLVNPECPIPEEIQALTGITNAMVRDKPTFAQLAAEILARLEGAVFVAHNARFDYGFVKNEFRRLGIPFTADVLCTVRLSRRMYPEAVSHGLDAVIERLGRDSGADPLGHAAAPELEPTVHDPSGRSPNPSPRTGRHSALGDARALWRFVQSLYRDREPPDVEHAVRRLLKIPSLPPQLPPDALEGLPEGPGVYRFYGVNDLPIYIGKSVNLRDRVRSHFSSDHYSANDLRISGEIRRIEFEETAGEMGALLREARLVKELLPLHNHRLRRKAHACFIRVGDLGSAPEVVRNDDIDWDEHFGSGATLYGPFATRPAVRKLLEQVAHEQGLCWRALGWEKRGGPCFARQVRKCRGACVGEETPQVHNLRLATALASWRVAAWPFPGRVMVRERHADGHLEEAHVFDRWWHVGTARDESELAALAETRTRIGFDPDVYKILQGHLRKRRALVQELSAPSCLDLEAAE
jgi:DNA polymerase-3 subunit epsilon